MSIKIVKSKSEMNSDMMVQVTFVKHCTRCDTKYSTVFESFVCPQCSNLDVAPIFSLRPDVVIN